MTDPIADMITRIKNALLASRQQVMLPHSNMKEAIARLLKEADYISSVEVQAEGAFKTLVLGLRYVDGMPAISEVRRYSKPGRRLYAPSKSLPVALGGYGLTIISTSKGIMSSTQARQQNVGGEVVCQVW